MVTWARVDMSASLVRFVKVCWALVGAFFDELDSWQPIRSTLVGVNLSVPLRPIWATWAKVDMSAPLVVYLSE